MKNEITAVFLRVDCFFPIFNFSADIVKILRLLPLNNSERQIYWTKIRDWLLMTVIFDLL